MGLLPRTHTYYSEVSALGFSSKGYAHMICGLSHLNAAFNALATCFSTCLLPASCASATPIFKSFMRVDTN